MDHPMPPELTETFVLLRDWHGGDRGSLDRLLERDLPWVRQYVTRRVGSLLKAKAELDDYVQEAAVQALQYAPRFLMSDRDQFRALLGRITENVLRDNVQRLTAGKRDAARERAASTDSMLDLDPPEVTVTRPSQAAARSEERDWIRLAIDLLEPEERTLVRWREWEELPFAEIAARLGIKEDAARMRFNRALPRLARTVRQLRRGDLGTVVAELEAEPRGA